MIRHQLVSMTHSLMISYMPQKKYIGPWLSVSVVVVLCVCLMSLELETGREINYTTSGSEIKTYSCLTWVRSCIPVVMMTKGRPTWWGASPKLCKTKHVLMENKLNIVQVEKSEEKPVFLPLSRGKGQMIR